MGRGTLEAANTEATMVETAVVSAMMDAGTIKLDQPSSVGPGTLCAVTSANGTTTVNVIDYCSGYLEAVYTLSASGNISSADGAGGKWKDLIWNEDVGRWEPQP